MWTSTELAYFAGVLDGEGCIALGGVTKGRFTCQLFLGNTDARMIHWIHARFGGTVRLRPRPANQPRSKPLWLWLLGGPELETVLTAVLPYLVIKREQVELALEFRKTVVTGRKGLQSRRTPPHIVEQRNQLKSRLAVLNKRGVA